MNADAGARILARADELAQFTEDPPRVTRTFLSPQHRAAGEKILGWMREAGMQAGFDALGNVIGRYEGAAPGAPALLTGSHKESVRNAGRYDGLLGILCPVECVRRLNESGTRLPSGAGHDAMAIAPIADIAMLFVRCGNGGISHHPDETLAAEDAGLAVDVMHDFMLNFRPTPAKPR